MDGAVGETREAVGRDRAMAQRLEGDAVVVHAEHLAGNVIGDPLHLREGLGQAY